MYVIAPILKKAIVALARRLAVMHRSRKREPRWLHAAVHSGGAAGHCSSTL
jgi:hypothetical protein